jgi:hypothetical protein
MKKKSPEPNQAHPTPALIARAFIHVADVHCAYGINAEQTRENSGIHAGLFNRLERDGAGIRIAAG